MNKTNRNASFTWSVLFLSALLAMPAQAGKLFISNERDNTVTVLDSNTFEKIATVETGRRPRGLITSRTAKKYTSVWVMMTPLTLSIPPA